MPPAAFRRAAAAALASLAASGCGGLPASPGRPPPALVGVPPTEEAVRPITVEDLAGLRDIDAFVVSPDGQRVAFLLRRADAGADGYVAGWFVADIAGGAEPVYLGDAGEPMLATDPDGGQVGEVAAPPAAWSPDGRWFAYLKQADGEVQLWRSRADGGRQEQLTRLASDARDFSWSADGRAILLRASRETRAEHEAAREAESRAGFLLDDRFFPGQTTAGPYYHAKPADDAWVVEFRGRRIRPATAAEIATSEERAPDGPGARTSADGRARAWRANDPDAVPFGGVRLLTSEGEEPGAPCRLEACGGALELVGWTGDAGEIVFRRRFGVARRLNGLYAWSPATGGLRTILETDALIEGCAPAAGDVAVCAWEAATAPRRLVSVDLEHGAIGAIVDPNPELAAVRFGAVDVVDLTNAWGHESFAQILMPPDYIEGQRYPVVVVTYRSRGFLRGGVGDEYPAHLFAAAGFVVLSFDMPDSDLYPAPETEAGAELEEAAAPWPGCSACAAGLLRHESAAASLELGLAELERRGLIDPDRVAVTGLSTGASIAFDALMHSERRFAAAIASYAAGDPITPYVGRRSWREGYFEQIGGLPEQGGSAYLDLVSPARNAAELEAPLLLHVADSELILSMQTIATLEHLRKPLEVFVFPNELHVKRSPAHRLAIYRRNLQWLQFWLQDREPDEPLDPGQIARWRALRALAAAE